jgi:hypothetical protein
MSQKTKIEYWKFGHYLIIGAWSLVINSKRRGFLTSPLVGCLMVPKGGFEPPRGLPTTPSRWRVYQFHHFGKMFNPSQPPLPTGRQTFTKGGEIIPPFIKGEKGGLFLRFRYRYLRLNRYP